MFRSNLRSLAFLDVPGHAYSRAILGVYEMTRIELLRDLYVWTYQRSAQEYLAIKQELAEPNPLRLAWRDLIKQVVKQKIPDHEQGNLQALIVQELGRLHEGVLARYAPRPSELRHWQE